MTEELRMQICKDLADTYLEISRLYNSLGKAELATLAQKFATIQLKRYARYVQKQRKQKFA